jgi:hypothetical protein
MFRKLNAFSAILFLVAILNFVRIAEPREFSSQKTCKMGAYVISLYDLDMSQGSFGADLWFWSTCDNKNLHPLDVMDFVNAKQLNRSLSATSERNGSYWSYVKISGIFRQTWDTRNYPFDRHDLQITAENTDTPASLFSYTIDRKGSKPSKDLSLEGWKLNDFKIEERSYFYDTNFGDPALQKDEKSEYSRLIISLPISRKRVLSFFKLSTGVYVAVALSMLTFLLGPYNGRRRINVLVGTLFAVVVNQRVVESEIGRSDFFTLVDKIHVVAMIAIFSMALASIYSQILFDREQKAEATRFDIRGLWIAGISYAIINALLVLSAAKG